MTIIERTWSANFQDGEAGGERPPFHGGTEWRRRWARPASDRRGPSAPERSRRATGEQLSARRVGGSGADGSPRAGAPRLSLVARLLRGFALWLERSAARAAERRMLHDLMRLDDHALRDIGLDRADLHAPIVRPFRAELDR